MFISKKLEVKETRNGKSLFAIQEIIDGEILIRFEGKVIRSPTKTSLQIDEGKHLEGFGEIDDFLNHSCDPNGHINFADLTFRALGDIKKGEEVTFNYLTSEWDMANKFECSCGSKNCFEHISGFRHLTLKQKRSIEHSLSPFLKKKLKESEDLMEDRH